MYLHKETARPRNMSNFFSEKNTNILLFQETCITT